MGAPLRSGRKTQRKPLDLLKVLVAYGGEAVSSEVVADVLWPDADGDHAAAALRTTLSRLRKLIGANAVSGKDRGLTLNVEACWVDALTLSRDLKEARRAHQAGCSEEAHRALEAALCRYHSAFLPDDGHLPPVLSARARLHTLFLGLLGELGACYERAGESSRALDVYRHGLEVDEAAEELACKLMHCCRDSGRLAEGVTAYRACQAAVRARFGVEPSPITRRAYRDLLAAPRSLSAPDNYFLTR